MSNAAGELAGLVDARGWSQRPAFHTDGRTYRHGEVHDLAARLAGGLAARGVRPGDRVYLALPDGIDWVVTFLAVARLGAIAVLVNPELPDIDHKALIADSTPVYGVTPPALEALFPVDRWSGPDGLPSLAIDAPPAPVHSVAGDAPLYVQYTSGTTGRPKGVVHRHSDLEVYADAVATEVLGVGPNDVIFSVSRLFYAYGFGNALVFPLFTGSSAVLTPDRPSADAVGELVATHRVTVLYAVPSAYAGLLAAARPEQFGSLRMAISAGEALPGPLVERLPALLGAPVLEQIGSTEAGHAFCANSLARNVPGSIGRPVPGYLLAVRAADGSPVPDGAEGELWVHGPTLLLEYLNQPAETARTLVDGWLATRDRVRRDAEGSYWHTGRVDDLEMVGGITVSPVEIEEVLAGHRAVREAAVAAVLDERGASRLRAFVVPAAPITDPAGLAAELTGLVRQSLAAFKVPRSVEVVASLPRTASGKLRRHVVRRGGW